MKYMGLLPLGALLACSPGTSQVYDKQTNTALQMEIADVRSRSNRKLELQVIFENITDGSICIFPPTGQKPQLRPLGEEYLELSSLSIVGKNLPRASIEYIGEAQGIVLPPRGSVEIKFYVNLNWFNVKIGQAPSGERVFESAKTGSYRLSLEAYGIKCHSGKMSPSAFSMTLNNYPRSGRNNIVHAYSTFDYTVEIDFSNEVNVLEIK